MTKSKPLTATQTQLRSASAKPLTLLEKKKRLLELKKKQAKITADIQEKKNRIATYEQDNKLLYFTLPEYQHLGRNGRWDFNPLQKRIRVAWENPNTKIFTLTGANRIGKTFMETLIIIASCIGRWPWEDERMTGHLWETVGWKPPIKIRWTGQDWEKHIKTVIIPSLKEMWPKSIPIEWKKNNVGVEALWTVPSTGATIEILSNKQESDVFEGWSGHLSVYDEPPKRDIRVACARGLIDFKGREVFGMTLLKEAWVDTDVINAVLEDGTPDPTVFSVNGEIWDNRGFGVTDEGINQFAKALTPEEKEARLRGIPSYKSGLILHIDRTVHFIARFPIPSHWPVDVAIDIGVAKPHDILYRATDPRGFRYLCFEENIKGDGTKIADSIIKKKQRYNLRINRILIDPLAKADQNNENSTYDKIRIGLNRFDMYLETASKDKDDGIISINNMLLTVNGLPAYFIFRDLPITTAQLSNWMYDKLGKPSKIKDDMCENAYRLELLNTAYEDPEDEDDIFDSPTATRNATTGY